MQIEIEQLERELVSAFGLGGRARPSNDVTERARVNVKRAITRAIARIDEVCPALAVHLERSIQTGRFCRYDPEPGTQPAWSVMA